MSDSGSIERYCSSYYDKHGLYNDGFPCPNDKYCCQTSDGAKMCCEINIPTKAIKSNRFIEKTTKSNIMLNTILNNDHEFNSNNNNNRINSFSNNIVSHLGTGSTNILYSTSSTLPILFSNTNILIALAVALSLLFILIIISLICICRCCISKKTINRNLKIPLKEEHQAHLFNNNNQYIKENDNNQGSSLKSFKKSDTNRNKNNVKNSLINYSRDSSSSCNSTTITSSSASPKINDITIFCGDDEVKQRILTIDTIGQHSNVTCTTANNNSSSLNIRQSENTSFLASANDSTNLKNINTNSIYGTTTLNSYMNALSSGSGSGSGSTCALLLNSNLNLTNTTQSSYLNNLNQNINIINNFGELNFDENDENDDDDETDFIVSTSSNLEFLKSHSLFNTTPLNYYPSLTGKKDTKTIEIRTNQLSQISNSLQSPLLNNTSISTPTTTTVSGTTNNLIDFRFSTFLPTTYVKNNEIV